jgi:hypothetical protein
MGKVYFQDYSDNETIIKGYVDSETKEGLAEVYRRVQNIYIDIPTNGVYKEPYSDKQFAHKFASEAIERAK